MQSSLMKRFEKGMKNRMPEDLDRNKPLNYLVINYILNDINHEWFGSETYQERKSELLMTASYICVAYRYSLRGYDGLWIDSQRLMYGVHFVKYDRRGPDVLVEVMGKFKGEDGYIMHLIYLVNVTLSGISNCMWLESLLALIKTEGNNNCPAFCDMEGYMLYAAVIERMFHPIMGDIQIHRDRNLEESIPRGMNVREHCWCNRSFHRGVEKQLLDNGVEKNVMNFVHRWSEYEVIIGNHPGFNMLEN